MTAFTTMPESCPALILEFRDAVKEGDGECVCRCWRAMLPHLLASRCTKCSLEALCLQFQVKALLSPHLAHQVLWHRFVNTRGGPGRNIYCDLYTEHMNKLIKGAIACMGASLTEKSLQRAARSVSTMHAYANSLTSSVAYQCQCQPTPLGKTKQMLQK